MNKILDLLDSASKAQGGHVFYNPNGDVRAVHPGKPVVRSILNLNSDVMPFMQEKDGGLTRAPQAKLAVENSRLSVSLVDASRIAQAGATVVVMPDPSKAFAVDGV
ncbi:hypothetical protein QCE63_35205, partial [Caballeronia sp. LZ065]|uniref:hypothetical protein n=1 Tax=Caballeronia sp. LZ065 TaxID=3038571 RepID=UPI0028647F82